mmetsp:Transcript_22588/g.36387  ORF Transcript_22588/g.36387 Transcript_22588/m.36387 type:complete len:200 (-) Transcript_22588:227-826(-)
MRSTPRSKFWHTKLLLCNQDRLKVCRTRLGTRCTAADFALARVGKEPTAGWLGFLRSCRKEHGQAASSESFVHHALLSAVSCTLQKTLACCRFFAPLDAKFLVFYSYCQALQASLHLVEEHNGAFKLQVLYCVVLYCSKHSTYPRTRRWLASKQKSTTTSSSSSSSREVSPSPRELNVLFADVDAVVAALGLLECPMNR